MVLLPPTPTPYLFEIDAYTSHLLYMENNSIHSTLPEQKLIGGICFNFYLRVCRLSALSKDNPGYIINSYHFFSMFIYFTFISLLIHVIWFECTLLCLHSSIHLINRKRIKAGTNFIFQKLNKIIYLFIVDLWLLLENKNGFNTI